MLLQAPLLTPVSRTIVTFWNEWLHWIFPVIGCATFKQVPARLLANVVLVSYLTPTTVTTFPSYHRLPELMQFFPPPL